MANQKTPRVSESPAVDPLEPFRKVEVEILQELKPAARRLKALGEKEYFPDYRARELREKFVSGVFEWAVRRMGKDLEKYLEEGRRNFLDKLKLILYDPYRAEPRQAKHFSEAFERADFFIPLKFSRRTMDHHEWPVLWAKYNKALKQAQEIKRKRWRNSAALKMRLKDVFCGINDKTADKFCTMKSSDIAAAYVQRDLKDSVGIEALKKYFKVFHTDPRYGYLDFLAHNLARVKQPSKRTSR